LDTLLGDGGFGPPPVFGLLMASLFSLAIKICIKIYRLYKKYLIPREVKSPYHYEIT
jgi:hypothetical protein